MDFLTWQAHLGGSHLHAFGKRASKPLLEALDPRDGERLLEIGCGTGATMVYVAARRRVRILGIDRRVEMLRMARRRLRLGALGGRCRVVRADATVLPSTDATFDRAYAESVIGFQDEESVLAILGEVQRVVRPGGIFVMNETLWLPGVSAGSKREIHDRLVRQAGTPPACRQDWDAGAWRRAAESRGWQVEGLERIRQNGRGWPHWRDGLSALFTLYHEARGRLDPGLREARARFSDLSIDDEFEGPVMAGYIAVLRRDPPRP